MACKGICIKYKVIPPYHVGPFTAGLKKCNTCNIFMKRDGFRCPYCKNILRTSSRGKSKSRESQEKGNS